MLNYQMVQRSNIALNQVRITIILKRETWELNCAVEPAQSFRVASKQRYMIAMIDNELYIAMLHIYM